MDPAARRKDKKKHNDFVDWLGFACDSEYEIPRLCPCGGDISEEVLEMEDQDTCPGKRYFMCKNYKKADGSHIRQPWVYGVSEEVERLIRRVEEAERVIQGVLEMMQKMQSLKGEVNHLKSVVANLTGQVDLLEKICFD